MVRKVPALIEWNREVFKRLITHLVSLPNCERLMVCKFWPARLLVEKTYFQAYPPTISSDGTPIKISPKILETQKKKFYGFMNKNIQYIQTAMKNYKEGHVEEIVPPMLRDRLQNDMKLFYIFWQYHYDLVEAEKNNAKSAPADIINAVFKQLYNHEPSTSLTDERNLRIIKNFSVRYLMHLKIPHVMPWDAPSYSSVGERRARNFIAKHQRTKSTDYKTVQNEFDGNTQCPICRQGEEEKITNVIFVDGKSTNKLFINHIEEKHLPLECLTCYKHFTTSNDLASIISCCEHPLICGKASEKSPITETESEVCKSPAAEDLTVEKIVERLRARKRARKDGYEKDTNLYPVKKHCITA